MSDKPASPTLLAEEGQEQHHLLRLALQATRSGVLITDALLDEPGPRILYANDAACRLAGYARAEMLGRAPRFLQGRDTDANARSRLREAMEAGSAVTVELLNYRGDGTPFMVELDITPVRDDDRVTHFIAIQTDVTERHALREEQRRQVLSFRLMFESNPMPMWVYDLETLAFLQVNETAVAKYGWSREEFLRRRVPEMLPPETCHLSYFEAPEHPGVHKMITSVHLDATGRPFPVHVAYQIINFERRPAALVTVWDVSEFEQTRAALAITNTELASLTESLTARTSELEGAARLAGMGLWTIDFSPRRLVWSPELYCILGQEPGVGPILSEQVIACVHPDDRRMFRESYRRTTRGGPDLQFEYRIVRPSGEVRTLRELSRLRRDAAGTVIGITGVIQDITEQKLAADALLRAEKLKTIGQITGGIAHDFNNLLTVIGLNLETVIDSEDLPAGLRELLEPAMHATHRSAELTGQLLSYARRQSLSPRDVELQSAVVALQPLLARAVGGQASLVVMAPPPDAVAQGRLVVEVDAGQFENAVMNLVINARDALGDQDGQRGEIVIAVDPLTLSAPLQALPDTIPIGAHVRVRVADNGSGIDPAVLPRIFEPFFTTKAIGTGSGLGLSMVYGFVHQSRGAMSISSTPGEGTIVDLYFPRAGAEGRNRGEAAQRFDAQSRSALVVEPRTDTRAAMLQLFRQLGFDTVGVASTEAALVELRSSRDYDLLFSDLTLPGALSGVQLAALAQRLRPELAVVLTSSDTRAIEAGATPWRLLQRPFDAEALIEVLGTLWP